jgi:hypothetical protein
MDIERYQKLLSIMQASLPKEAIEPALHTMESLAALRKAIASYDAMEIMTERGFVELFENLQNAAWRIQGDIQKFLAVVRAARPK